MAAVLTRPRRGDSALAAGEIGRPASSRKWRRTSFPYALLAPIVIFEAIFVVYPIIKGAILSTETTQAGKTTFVGLANFREMINNPTFWSSLTTTFEFTFSMVLVWLVLGLGVGLLMNWSFKGRSFIRGLLALPWAIPDIPVVVTFTMMLDPNFGVLNRFISLILGVNHHIQWFAVTDLAFLAIVMMVGWKGFPFFGLIFLASLQGIPDDLYEAAQVDGAGMFRRFRYVTFPAILPTTVLLAVLAFIFSFQQFTIIYLSTGGGPGVATSTLSVSIYLNAFEYFDYNYASAIAVVGLFLALVVTLLFIFVERRLARSQALETGAGALI
jgi:multiple sugar transport system permease protein